MTAPVKAALEALLFATNHPLSMEAAAEALNASADEVQKGLEALDREYAGEDRGIRLAELAGGWQILTRPELGAYVEKMLAGRRRTRLSRAGLEALAAVAYHQPITRGEIDAIRGVDSSGALRTLLERDLVTVKGRSDRVGRPLLYVTTPEFLEYFGLRSVADLPDLEDFASLIDRDALRRDTASEPETEVEEPAGEGVDPLGGGEETDGSDNPDESLSGNGGGRPSSWDGTAGEGCAPLPADGV